MSLLNSLISPQIIETFGWTLLHSLWQGILIAIILKVLLISLTNQSSRIRYLLSTSALAVLFAAVVNTFTNSYSAIVTASNSIESAIAPVQILIKNSEGSFNILAFQFWGTSVSEILTYFQSNMHIIVLLWFAGILFLTIRFTYGMSQISAIRRSGTTITDKWMIGNVEKYIRKLKLNSVSVLVSAKISVPIAIGVLKPAILFPLGMLNSFPGDQTEAILLHELAHIKRKDYLVNLIQSVMEIIFFFNPAVWFISGSIRKERENCCDDIVVDITGDKLSYVKALSELERNSFSNYSLILAAVNNKNQLIKRIERIVFTNRIGGNPMFKSIIIMILFAGLAVASVGSINIFSHNNNGSAITQDSVKVKSTLVEPKIASLSDSSKDYEFDEPIEVPPPTEPEIVELPPSPEAPPELEIAEIPPAPELPAEPLKGDRKIRLSDWEGYKSILIGYDENDNLNLLELDGKVISKENYDDYSDLIKKVNRYMREQEEKVRLESKKLKEQSKKLQIVSEELRQKSEALKQEIEQMNKQQLKENENQIKVSKKELEEKLIELNKQQKQIIEQKKDLEKINERVGHEKHNMKQEEKVFKILLQKLEEDGLITDPNHTELLINENKMMLNGKEMTSETHGRYKKMYEKLSKEELTGDKNFHVISN